MGKSDNDPVNYEVLFDEPFMGGQSLRGSNAFENKLYVMPEWSLLNISYGTRLKHKKQGLPSPLLQAQQKRQQPSRHHNKGVPADYKPSNRGGVYHRDFYSAWKTPPVNTDQRNASPNGRSPNTDERYSNPRHRFASPEFNSPNQRSRFSPRFNTPRKHLGYSPLNSQVSPRDASRFYTPPRQSPDSRQAVNTSEQLSAKESERVIRQLLHLDGSSESNPNLNSPHATFNAPDNAFQMPPLSPTSPISPSNPSGLLVLACHQNRWPEPTFSHHRIAQHFITTVCVAGKMFQGLPCVTIEEAAESAAQTALMALFPQASPIQNNGMISPFAFPLSPNVPPFNLSPTQGPHPNNSSPRNNTPKKRDSTSTSTPGCQDKKSESTKDSSSRESLNTSKADSSSLFIPLQVSLKKKELVNTSSTKTSEDAQEPTKPETEEPTTTLETGKLEEEEKDDSDKDASDKDTTIKPNENESSNESLKNARTSIKNNAGTKVKPILLAPSYFTAKE